MIFGLFGGDKKRVAEMIAAARSGNTEKIKQLLAKGADVNAPEPESGDTPLLAAIDKGQWAAAELLLKQRPDLSLQDKNGNSPLYLTVSLGDSVLPMVNLLLEAGANTELGPSQGDNAGATPLHIVCALGANGCLESLLRHGASLTKQLPDGAFPLHTSAVGGDKTTIELLCKAGASVTALNNDKRTALHNCGITGNAQAAAALIQLGAEVDSADSKGCTPLMHAVLENHTQVAKVLLDNGADPDVVYRTGNTTAYPLFVAAMKGNDDLIRVLLDKGANVAAKVDTVVSLLDAAKHNGHESSAKLISDALKRHRASAKAEKTEKESKELLSYLETAWKNLDGDALQQIADSRLFGKLPAASRLAVLAVHGDIDGVSALLASGVKPDIASPLSQNSCRIQKPADDPRQSDTQ